MKKAAKEGKGGKGYITKEEEEEKEEYKKMARRAQEDHFGKRTVARDGNTERKW